MFARSASEKDRPEDDDDDGGRGVAFTTVFPVIVIIAVTDFVLEKSRCLISFKCFSLYRAFCKNYLIRFRL